MVRLRHRLLRNHEPFTDDEATKFSRDRKASLESSNSTRSNTSFLQRRFSQLSVSKSEGESAEVLRGPLGLNLLHEPSDPHLDLVFVRRPISGGGVLGNQQYGYLCAADTRGFLRVMLIIVGTWIARRFTEDMELFRQPGFILGKGMATSRTHAETYEDT